MEFVVRGIGLVESAADLEKTVLAEREGTPIYLRDVATVQIGGEFRRGALDVNGREVVGGIVVMRTGENARAVIQAIKTKIEQITPSLPPGVTIRSFYDRSDLIDRTIDTLKHALVEEIILVTLAHVIFLFTSQHPDCHLSAAGLDPHLVHPHASVRHLVEYHVA
jgi:Cu(I)/Ag(I) efflux system membrane protein CusA/SilA